MPSLGSECRAAARSSSWCRLPPFPLPVHAGCDHLRRGAGTAEMDPTERQERVVRLQEEAAEKDAEIAALDAVIGA